MQGWVELCQRCPCSCELSCNSISSSLLQTLLVIGTKPLLSTQIYRKKLKDSIHRCLYRNNVTPWMSALTIADSMRLRRHAVNRLQPMFVSFRLLHELQGVCHQIIFWTFLRYLHINEVNHHHDIFVAFVI